MRKTKPEWQQRIARERIEILFSLAEKEFAKHPERSRMYIQLARKIGTRYNIRMTGEQKKNFCKNCNSFLVPGKTSTIRLDSRTGSLIIKCENCNRVYRHPYK